MKKHYFTTIALLLPLTGSALPTAPLDGTCALNSICSFSMFGQFNKIIHTYDIKANKSYECKVINDKGEQFRISDNVQTSPGVTYTKGDTFATPFVIHGPNSGEGAITYTLHNRDKKFWKRSSIQYKCDTVQS